MRSTSELASLEGSYRSAGARHWDYSEDKGRNGVHLGVAPSSSVKVDTVDAAAVERAVCAMDIFHHVILKAEFVRQWPPSQGLYQAWKAAGERKRTRDYDREAAYAASLKMATALLGEVVDRPAVIRRRRALLLAAQAVGMPMWEEAYA